MQAVPEVPYSFGRPFLNRRDVVFCCIQKAHSQLSARSNVESTFSAVKRKFGDSLKAKTTAAQKNELLCKLIAYNISVLIHEMFELGITPNFAVEEKVMEMKK